MIYVVIGLMIIQIVILVLILSVLYKVLELVRPTPQTGHVSGTCTYGESQVSDVAITLINSEGTTVLSSMTDADGAFAFEEIAIGKYIIHAHKDVEEGFLTGDMDIEIIGGDEVAVELPLVISYYNYGHNT
jgi:hypothetical protein